jgi:hypothetical protein
MLVVLPLANAQGGQAPPAAQAAKEFEGQLTKVDATAKTISVKGSAGEMLFRYDDKTQVQGPEKDIQGLAGKSGTPLKVTYREAGDNRIAIAIQVLEKR